jgi:quinol monooxygenase YgiN
MIYEIADINVEPDRAADFEMAVAECAALFREVPDCLSFRLERSVDRPGGYRLVVGWKSVDAHMVGFRRSECFARWRAIAGPFFLRPPAVDHVETALEPF